ncbi:MAG: hypothetical protein ACOYMD_05175 [Paludibacter sp.]
MTTIELKSNFHNLIDTINDVGILSKFYDLLSNVKESKDGLLWNRLSIEEQNELMQIEKDSQQLSNLISGADMINKHKKWL